MASTQCFRLMMERYRHERLDLASAKHRIGILLADRRQQKLLTYLPALKILHLDAVMPQTSDLLELTVKRVPPRAMVAKSSTSASRNLRCMRPLPDSKYSHLDLRLLHPIKLLCVSTSKHRLDLC